ncbi:M48 family metallopeptidase [Sulfitobacter sabulilitoris]|uniref:M48 family metallopeptidase n=1 Tax=Sulfitobacter sabulilitoris TaxID=2562655 RepID=A0A5S3Q7L9_9RHOB|nr:SprT family zinc-dependent metalloprotease [Sulfitobacter sabulilitoris]TMM52853.1 M48 family metallopeptidase [Sulfitobacter sabulilitoris]
MSDHFLPGAPPIPLILRRSPRARRISLRISQLDGRVTLTLPRGVRDAEALRFAAQKEEWIRGHLDARGADVVVRHGAHVPIGGTPHHVVPGVGRRIEIAAGRIAVPGAAQDVGPRLAGHLKQLARNRLAEASDHFAARLGVRYDRITLRDTRSRWGSCTADGGLMYSWRLILAPPEVLSYVAAHEVAHLVEMNHSPAFWARVTDAYGDYSRPRGWLRGQGGDLHRYRFAP